MVFLLHQKLELPFELAPAEIRARMGLVEKDPWRRCRALGMKERDLGMKERDLGIDFAQQSVIRRRRMAVDIGLVTLLALVFTGLARTLLRFGVRVFWVGPTLARIDREHPTKDFPSVGSTRS